MTVTPVAPALPVATQGVGAQPDKQAQGDAATGGQTTAQGFAAALAALILPSAPEGSSDQAAPAVDPTAASTPTAADAALAALVSSTAPVLTMPAPVLAAPSPASADAPTGVTVQAVASAAPAVTLAGTQAQPATTPATTSVSPGRKVVTFGAHEQTPVPESDQFSVTPATTPGARAGDQAAPPALAAVDEDLPTSPAPTSAAPSTDAPAAVVLTVPSVAAPTMSSPVASSAAATPATAVATQVHPEVTRLATNGNGTHRISIVLNPAHLGEVTLSMVVRDGSVRVSLNATDNQAVQRALTDGAPDLQRLLERVGVKDSQILVGQPGAAAQPLPGGQTAQTSGQLADLSGRSRHFDQQHQPDSGSDRRQQTPDIPVPGPDAPQPSSTVRGVDRSL